jgi:peptidoglycan hydrolase-like amidase
VPRAAWAAVFLLFATGETCQAQEVRVGILSRYHPRAMELRAAQTEAVVLRIVDRNLVVAPGNAREKAEIAMAGGELLVTIDGREYRAHELQASGRAGAEEFLLVIPGQISRRYQGKLSLSVREGELAAVLTLPLETAVASVVQAESSPGTSEEALAALAVVARSYFMAAKKRHADFDFCDLTHCQVLREPPSPASPAARAARETRGLVLTYKEQPFATMFTRSCSGRTRTPAQDGMTEAGYPYFAVICDYCHSHPVHWTRTV